MRVEAIGVVDMGDTAMQQNIVGSNEWRAEPEGFVGEERKDVGTVRHSTRT